LRGVINTLLSITTSTIAAFLVSRIFKHGQLDIEIILNSTLAGGVVMGAAADLIHYPFCAMIAGYCAGSISAIGYLYIGPFLKRKINLHDTCGVLNLHGIPGILGAFVAVIASNRWAKS
jgi:ammonium transporter Rh